MSDTSGHISLLPFAFYDPDMSCLRTCEVTLLSDSTEFSVTLPVSGSMRSGRLFQQPKLVLAIGGNDSSSLPLIGTPVAAACPRSKAWRGSGNPTPVELVNLLLTPQATNNENRTSDGYGMNLGEALLPTPTRRDHKGRNQRNDDTCLPGALLPTPRAQDGPHGGPGQTNSRGEPDSLPAIGALLPTPMADNSRGLPSPNTDYQSLANTAQQLTDGPASSDDHHPNPPTTGDSTQHLWNG